MTTLLQALLLRTLPLKLDLVLLAYIETVMPAVEQMFEMFPMFHKSKDGWINQPDNLDVTRQPIRSNNAFDQSLSIYVLNSLLVAWTLLPLLKVKPALSKDEKRLLCLSFTFQGYKNEHKLSANSLVAYNSVESMEWLQAVGETLKLDSFWAEWREHLPEIVYLIQPPQQQSGGKTGTASPSTYKIPEPRLQRLLQPLISFGTLAAQLTDPADVVLQLAGDRLREELQTLGIDRTLVYHRLRSCTGLLTNSIHNAVLQFVEKLDWYPILFFAQGVIYLAPAHHKVPDRSTLQEFLWEQLSTCLAGKMLEGAVGFKRDGKGLKVAPQALELLSPVQFVRNLPSAVESNIRNEKYPVTLKRLEKLNLNPTEREFLARGADLRSDRLAEFILFLQRQFFKDDLEFIVWVLEKLDIQSTITPEQTQICSGGVNWGWYYAAAYYIASHPELTLKDVFAKLQEIADQLAPCVGETILPTVQKNDTRNAFYDYIAQHLEVEGWNILEPSFKQELEGYLNAKTKVAKQPICSLSSGEFASEDQMDSVVLFKPQQYSNKNPLGGRQIKRGISKIWSLEMLLRQAFWSIPAGKLEDQQPVFLYISPALVHAPQVTKAIQVLVNQLKQVNLWEVRRFWRDHGMDAHALRFYPWLRGDPNPAEEDKQDLPFMAITYTTTRGSTTTDAWVEPAFLALALPLLLGVKVVATASSVPSYHSHELQEVVKLDEPASFWNLLGLPTSISLEAQSNDQCHLNNVLNRLLIAYSVHLGCRGSPPDPRWQAFPGTARELATDGLAIFGLAHAHFQRSSNDEIQRYWHFAHLWSAGSTAMEQQLELTQRLVQEYRTFYKVHVADSSYAIVLPLSKVLEDILSTPSDVPIETLLVQSLGRLHDAIRRQKPYHRPLLMDQSLSIEIRANNELLAVQQFVTTCVEDLFLGQYKGNRALLQEHRHRIKSGAEAAYRLLAMQEPKPTSKKQQTGGEMA